jgi:hypothetical protein
MRTVRETRIRKNTSPEFPLIPGEVLDFVTIPEYQRSRCYVPKKKIVKVVSLLKRGGFRNELQSRVDKAAGLIF